MATKKKTAKKATKAKKAKSSAKPKKAKEKKVTQKKQVKEAPAVAEFDYDDSNPGEGQACRWEGLLGFCDHILKDENGNPVDAVFISYSNFGETRRTVPYTDLVAENDR